VIVRVTSCGFEFARFQGSDFTERDTNFHPQLAHLANDLKHAIKFFRTVAHAAPRCAHAKARRAMRTCAAGSR